MNWSWNKTALVCIAVTAFVMVFAIAQLRSNQRNLANDIARHNSVNQQVQEYLSLSNAQQDTLYGTKPQSDIEARLVEAMQSSQITPAPPFQVTIQTDREVRSTGTHPINGLHEQEISIRIPGLTTKQIGDILVYWRDQQHVWTPKHISIDHDQRSNTNRYTLKLDCIAVYHADGA